jgi:formylglycine-generating enzyme required for sulfatase activity
MPRLSLLPAALALAALLLPAASRPAPDQPPSVLVRPPASAELDPSVGEALGELFTEQLARSQAFRSVVSTRDVTAMLRHEQEKQLFGCDDSSVSCLAEIGGAMGADQLAMLEVTLLGKAYVVGARLIDLRSATVRFRQTATIHALEAGVPIIQELAQKLASAARLAGAPESEAAALSEKVRGAQSKATDTVRAVAEAERAAAAAKVARASALAAPRPGMVLVPAGRFFFGCNAQVDPDCLDNEKPGRSIETDAFKIDLREVTLDDFRRCVDAGACAAPDDREGCLWGAWFVGSRPANCVSWTQAKAFCAWSGKRLPTAREWEKAARGLDGRRYPWGNEVLAGAARLEDIRSVDVGSYPAGASPYGALDMVGNVAEWTDSTYDDQRYEVRGGGFLSAPRLARISARNRSGADAQRPDLGFPLRPLTAVGVVVTRDSCLPARRGAAKTRLPVFWGGPT